MADASLCPTCRESVAQWLRQLAADAAAGVMVDDDLVLSCTTDGRRTFRFAEVTSAEPAGAGAVRVRPPWQAAGAS